MLRRLPQNGGFLLSAILILASLTVLLTSYPASIPTWAASGLLGGTQDEPRSTRIHLFIPMTKDAAMSNKRFCRGVESAIVNGWEPIVFNWDSDHPQPKKNKVYSWHALLSSPAHTQNISGDDLVFLMDGMDAWLQLSPDIMARRYEEYDGKIMVGADKNFWPEQGPVDGVFPQSPLPLGLYNSQDEEDDSFDHARPRYANSGTILGHPGPVRELLEGWSEILEDPTYLSGWDDDQGGLNLLLSRGQVEVDYLSRLFWVSAYDADNVKWINTPSDPDLPTVTHRGTLNVDAPIESKSQGVIPWHLYPSLAHHIMTGQVPVVLHLNDAGKKHHLEEHWNNNWWASGRKRFQGIAEARLKGGMLRFVTDEGYRTEEFWDICSILSQ